MPILTSKGQVTIPKPVRDRLHIKEGDSVVFEVRDDVVVVRKETRKSILTLGGFIREGIKNPRLKSKRSRRS